MVKKYVYQFTSYDDREHNAGLPHLHQSFLLNDHVHRYLKRIKDCISEHYKNKRWDKYKKLANEYELIYTSSSGSFPSIAAYPAISRSFFKMWEMLTDFEDVLQLKHRTGLKAVFLAEGPGGFLEAYARFRPRDLYKCDTVYGITLISQDRSVPNWRLPTDIMGVGNVHLLKGIDETGSLYNVSNIDSFVLDVGKSKANLVTSDGGFDFSNNFNSQESLSVYLIACEVYTALRLQAIDGTFILKVYDIHMSNTLRILSLLVKVYEKVHVTKPLSSRPANSEKYLVCTGFKGNIEEEIMDVFRTVVRTKRCELLEVLPIDAVLTHQAVHFNIFYIGRQVLHIQKTLNMISTLNLENTDTEYVKTIHAQVEKSIRWCHKYGISISKKALSYYFSILKPESTTSKKRLL